MTSDAAETIALKALAYLANREDALTRFMALSGAGMAELRERAGEPDFLAGVTDFLLGDEELLTGFCEAETLDARSVHMALHVLAGA